MMIELFQGVLSPQYINKGDSIRFENEITEIIDVKRFRNGHSRISHFYLSNGRYVAGIANQDKFEVFRKGDSTLGTYEVEVNGVLLVEAEDQEDAEEQAGYLLSAVLTMFEVSVSE